MLLVERKRFLAALIISAVFHGVLLVALGFWSLNIPAPPELPPLLTVTITPETRVAEKSVVPEKVQEAVEVQRPEKPPEKKAESLKKVPEKVPAAKLNEPLSQPEFVPAVPKAREGDDSEYLKNLALARESTVPLSSREGSSEVVYDTNDTAEKENTAAPAGTSGETAENSILSREDLQKLASSLDSSPAEAQQTVTTEKAGTAGKKETASALIPENATLLLERGTSNREPTSRLHLDIPPELLSGLDHDGSVTVEFTLSPVGRIIQPFVKRSSVDAEIGTEVLKALRKWGFNQVPEAEGSITGEITIFFKVK